MLVWGEVKGGPSRPGEGKTAGLDGVDLSSLLASPYATEASPRSGRPRTVVVSALWPYAVLLVAADQLRRCFQALSDLALLKNPSMSDLFLFSLCFPCTGSVKQ